MEHRTVTLVAKGPSAAFADEWKRGDVAVVNDAGKLVSGPIRYAFYTDDWSAEQMRCFSNRVEHFVTTSRAKTHLSPATIVYQDDACGAETSHLKDRILSGGICHHHTTPGAIHWLAKFGRYSHIRVIGVDGGKNDNYHQGVSSSHRFLRKQPEGFLDKWKELTIKVAKLIQSVYDTEIVFYEP